MMMESNISLELENEVVGLILDLAKSRQDKNFDESGRLYAQILSSHEHINMYGVEEMIRDILYQVNREKELNELPPNNENKSRIKKYFANFLYR